MNDKLFISVNTSFWNLNAKGSPINNRIEGVSFFQVGSQEQQLSEQISFLISAVTVQGQINLYCCKKYLLVEAMVAMTLKS
jgi:hypothetical protein